MSEVIRFPDRYEEARQRGEAFQRLSPEERIREIAAMSAFGRAQIQASPYRAEIEQRMEEQERQWQEIQKAIFAKYAVQAADDTR